MTMQAHSQVTPGAADDVPGFGEYLGILRKRRRLLLMVAMPIVALGGLLAVGLPDIYRSSGLIQIEGAEAVRRPDNLQSIVAREADEPMYADQYVQSLSTQVLSDKNLRRLLQERRIYDDQDKDLAAATKKLRRDIDVDIVTVPILDPETGREREVVTAFSVAFDHRDPERALEGAKWVVNSYITENRNDRRGYAESAAKFFATEAERMGKRVAELEGKLAEFKAKNVGQLPELTEMNLSVMDRTENEIQNIESQMQALRRERVFLMAQLQQARATGPETASLRGLEEEYKRRAATYDESHPDLISLRRQMDALRSGGSTTGQTLRQQLATQRSILAEARQRYGEEHPDIKRISRTIQSLEARIAAGESADRSLASDSPMAVQLSTQLNATDTQIGALQARSIELRAKLSDLEGRMVSAPEVERGFQNVTRDLTSARTKYEELLKRQMDAEVSEAAIAGGTADKFRVKSAPAMPREPDQPERLAIFIIAIVFAIGISITAVVLAQLLDQTVRGIRDVRDILDVTPLSAVPVIQHTAAGRARAKAGVAYASHAAALVAACYLAGQFIT
jgi:polysaccharide biosynthesis transport protein